MKPKWLFATATISLLSTAFVYKTIQNKEPLSYKKGFQIIGEIKGYPDGTKIYLHDSETESNLDSAILKKGKFLIKGTLKVKAKPFFLLLPNSQDYSYLWIENTVIHYSATKGKFKQAIVKGSFTQLTQNKLNKVIMPVRAKQFSLKQLIGKDTSSTYTQHLRRQLNASIDQEMLIEQQFIRDNGNSLVSGNDLNIYKEEWGKQKVKQLYSYLSPAIKQSDYGKSIKNYINYNRDIKIGDKYVDFKLNTLQGKATSLSSLNNKVIYLEFWASNCGPCRMANPQLIKVYQQYQSKGFEILGVSLDANYSNWKQAVNDDKLPWTNVVDLKAFNSKVASIYGIYAIPNSFLIDKTGTIIEHNLEPAALRKKLDELL
ncbi:AhpC/TSA family protein [Mucilaginibacter robiniae]|uniref:AhpC/TSA family protein n=1 Tax=Mucilaginibacter robiniae TaxID=2728022 RepID=A0A7L5DZ28_9SPHI|nr:TlpA disulfide reductase family protein [Mucilaginibacter robiniae]QJD94534.1 AhpC/TSA family protein [Mucilaginibacter robiniae]